VRSKLGWALAALDALAVASLGFYIALAVPWSLLRSGDELSQAVRSRESRAAARLRVHGEAYTRGIDEIRRQLPLDQAYLLVEAGEQPHGGAYWVRYDLAPRRAIFLGREDELTDPSRVRKRLTANLRQVVISYGPKLPPRLLPRYVFMQEIERRQAAAPIPGVPGAPPTASGVPGALSSGVPGVPTSGVPAAPASGVPGAPPTASSRPAPGRPAGRPLHR
jgi:hypothetical protein